jgi:hypothetical protein
LLCHRGLLLLHLVHLQVLAVLLLLVEQVLPL